MEEKKVMKLRQRVIAFLLVIALAIPLVGGNATMTVNAEEAVENTEEVTITDETAQEIMEDKETVGEADSVCEETQQVDEDTEGIKATTETELDDTLTSVLEEYEDLEEANLNEQKLIADNAEVVERRLEDSTEELYIEEGPEINAADSTKFYASDAIVPGVGFHYFATSEPASESNCNAFCVIPSGDNPSGSDTYSTGYGISDAAVIKMVYYSFGAPGYKILIKRDWTFITNMVNAINTYGNNAPSATTESIPSASAYAVSDRALAYACQIAGITNKNWKAKLIGDDYTEIPAASANAIVDWYNYVQTLPDVPAINLQVWIHHPQNNKIKQSMLSYTYDSIASVRIAKTPMDDGKVLTEEETAKIIKGLGYSKSVQESIIGAHYALSYSKELDENGFLKNRDLLLGFNGTFDNNLSDWVNVEPGRHFWIQEIIVPSSGLYELSGYLYGGDEGFVVENGQTLTIGVTFKPVESSFINVHDETVIGESIIHPGYMTLSKKSSNTSITKNNRCYDLAGAEYEVYKVSSNTDSSTTDLRGRFRVDSDGKGHVVYEKASGYVLKSGYSKRYTMKLEVGNYMIKETKAPTNGSYALDKTVYRKTVTKNNTEENPIAIAATDSPNGDPARMLVKKKDAKKEKYLDGAVYEVKYYDVYSTKNPAKSGENAKATWYFKTDKKGYARYGSEWLDKSKKNSAIIVNEDNDPTIPYGTITVREVEAPEGYVLDSTMSVYKIDAETVEESDTVRENKAIKTNTPIKQPFSLIKLGETGNGTEYLEGAGFSACCIKSVTGQKVLDKVAVDYEAKKGEVVVKDEEGNSYLWDDSKRVALTKDGGKELFTDKHGYALSTELDYGTYIVRETTVPNNHFKVDDFTVVIDKDSREPKELGYFTDESFKAYLKIIKKDSKSDKSILNNPATFKIWDYGTKEYVSFEVDGEQVSEFKTDENGILMTPDVLYPGSYMIEETENPKGYYSKRAPFYDIEINSDAVYVPYVDADGNQTKIGVFTVEFDNTPIYGKILVSKKGGILVYDEKLKEFVITEEKLSDIKFDVVADEDIKAPYDENEVIYKKGEVVTQLVTDKEGNAETDLLPLGAYLLKEYTPAEYEEIEPIKVTIALDSDFVSTSTDEEDSVETRYVYEKVDVVNKPKVPEIKTKAWEKKSGSSYAKQDEKITVVDRVEYKNLVTDGREYTLKGKLYLVDKQTPLLVDGKEVTAEKTFIPKKADGYEELEFTFDASALKGTVTVVFEDLYEDEKKVATHSEITDRPQQIAFPSLKTTARDSETGTQKAKVSKTTKIIDTVCYEGVFPNEKFILKGKLYDRATGKPLLVNGAEVTSELEVVPENSNGIVEVEFVFDSTGLEGMEVTVFEYAYTPDNELIVSHEDLTDDYQTITFDKKPELPPDTPKTGDSTKPLAIMIVMFVSAIAGGIVLAYRRRKLK